MRYVLHIGFAALTLAATVVTHAQQPNGNPSGAFLTFLSHRSGHNQLYSCHQDGTQPSAIFGGPLKAVPSFDDSFVMFREPHWTRQSPNGRYFASWVYETGKPYSNYQGALRPMLWVGDIAGTWTRILNPDCNEEFAWSPDSKQLAFSILSTHHYRGSLQKRPTTTEICISSIDGSHERCVLEKHGKWFVLDWSPDGKRLLLENRQFGQQLEDGTSALFEFRVSDAINARNRSRDDQDWAANGATRFLNQIDLDLEGMQPCGARYSPTRNELALEVHDPRNMYAPNLVADEDDELGRGRMMRLLEKIYVYNMDTRGLRKVADYEEGIRGPICWSPNGDDILFSRYLAKDDDREKTLQDKEHGLAVWAIGRDGDHARFVTTGWSPDYPRMQTGDGR